MNKLYLLTTLLLVTNAIVFAMDENLMQNPEPNQPFIAITHLEEQGYESEGDIIYSHAQYPGIIGEHINQNRPSSAITHTYNWLDVIQQSPHEPAMDGYMQEIANILTHIRQQTAQNLKGSRRVENLSLRIDSVNQGRNPSVSPIHRSAEINRDEHIENHYEV